jgi:hypothetical protein
MSNGSVSLNRLGQINSGDVTMIVDPRLGGRILSFAHAGEDILLPESAVQGTDNANNFGITFWPSPQSTWSWPPQTAIDSDPYAATESGNSLVMTSGEASFPDGAVVILEKRFAPVPGKDAIDVTYQLKNVGKVSVNLATWQIARVRAGGLTFFRLGSGGVSSDKLATVTASGVQWYKYDATVVTAQGQKTFADATGWVAHADGDLIFIQSYPDVAPGAAAAGEAEMELYADPSHTYVEIEPQGAASQIAPGGVGPSWNVRCFLAKLPAQLDTSVGSAALTLFVETLISG